AIVVGCPAAVRCVVSTTARRSAVVVRCPAAARCALFTTGRWLAVVGRWAFVAVRVFDDDFEPSGDLVRLCGETVGVEQPHQAPLEGGAHGGFGLGRESLHPVDQLLDGGGFGGVALDHDGWDGKVRLFAFTLVGGERLWIPRRDLGGVCGGRQATELLDVVHRPGEPV